MLRIQNIVPKHFIYWLSKIEMNSTLHRGVSLTNLVTRDEQRILYLVHLILFSVNNIICCLDVDHLDDLCDVCVVVYF